jgi:uncharacterized membrane protein
VAYALLMFVHVGAMFLATALAVGPSVLTYLVARTGDPAAIRRTLATTSSVYRVAGATYGVGILFGVLTAINGALDLTSTWLLAAYVLIALLIATNFAFERWTRRLTSALEEPAALDATVRDPTGLYYLTGMIVLTLAIVFVMVVKPTSGG